MWRTDVVQHENGPTVRGPPANGGPADDPSPSFHDRYGAPATGGASDRSVATALTVDADPDLAAAIRSWECRTMARILPLLAVFSTIALACFALLGARRFTVHDALGIDSVLLAYAAALACTRQERASDAAQRPISVRRALLYDAIGVGLGFAWCAYAGALYSGGDPERQMLGDAMTCGLIGQSLVFAMRRRVCLLMMTTIGGASVVARMVLNLPGGITMTALLGVYLVCMLAVALVACAHLRRHLLSDRRLRAEQELTGLLLRDFEDASRDCLWQTDDRNVLVHVSSGGSGLRRMFGGLTEGDSLTDAERNGADGAAIGVRALVAAIETRMPFHDLVVEIPSGEQTEWWSFGGKPLFGHAGRFLGFRGIGSDVTEMRASQLRIEHLAHCDPLTGLPNRSMFQRRQQEDEAAGGVLSVLLVDLDGFKSVNDAHGHPVGDALLARIGGRLREEVQPPDIAARLGGDEFAILTPVSDRAALEAMASRLIEVLSRPLRIDGIRLAVGASIGIARPGDLETDSLAPLKAADLALYRAKRDGRGTYRFFDAAMDQALRARNAMQLELRAAVEQDGFDVHFQPIYDLVRSRITGCETLARWCRPTGQVIPPSEFIPIAEQTGLILPLGRHVLRRACEEASFWPSELTVAVNVSPLQFRDPGFLASIDEALLASGLAPHRLELEVTESLLLDHRENSVETLRLLHQRGIRISLDDFGTGYSSLSYLRLFPFDKIKIDQSFVVDLEAISQSRAIVQAIIGLGEGLGMTTIAEGVETRRQAELLLESGCTHVQGYLISPPVDPDQILEIVFAGGRQNTPELALT